MAGFISWVSRHYDELVTNLPTKLHDTRTKLARMGQHRRTDDILANLAMGFSWFVTFAHEVGVLDGTAAGELTNARAFAALAAAGTAQEQLQRDQEPTAQFLGLLRAALSSGRAHMAGVSGIHPDTPEPWGWRYTEGNWRPSGRRIGWVEGTDAGPRTGSVLRHG